MKKLEKMAAKDAEAWAAAEMAYGEGAGTRRKLIDAQLQPKFAEIPGYWDAFDKAYSNLNMDHFAKQAIRERKAMDRAAKASKNLRALKSGNLHHLSTGLYIIAGGYTIARLTGYDVVIKDEAIRLYKKAEVEVKIRNAKRKMHAAFDTD